MEKEQVSKQSHKILHLNKVKPLESIKPKDPAMTKKLKDTL